MIINNNIISTLEIIGISRMHVKEQEDGRASIVHYHYKIYTRFTEIEIVSDAFQFSKGFHEIDRKKIEEFNADFLAAQRRISIILGEKFCRTCSCTETTPCIDHNTGIPCHWIEEDLCSACAEKINSSSINSKQMATKTKHPANAKSKSAKKVIPSKKVAKQSMKKMSTRPARRDQEFEPEEQEG